MKAAVVTTFDQPPHFADAPEPVASDEHQRVIDVLASGLHPRVRSQAAGSHYTSDGVLPLIPGIDGVGRDPDGSLRYFLLLDTPHGAMAQRTVIDERRSIALPEGADPVAIAAAMNPAMSSWVALRRRTQLPPDARVLVLGATGSAGRLAVRVARLLGASEVIAAGRDTTRLAALASDGADATVSLAGADEEVAREIAQAASEVDVVIDYLWGEPSARAMGALITARRDRARPLTWIEIGAIAGPTAAIPSAALRAARLQIVGSGQGSVPTAELAAELPELARQIAGGAIVAPARAVPLAEVEQAWDETGTEDRIVITP
jgi:NADPH:quinone reductase-like Zn-dependent oxidoreductase